MIYTFQWNNAASGGSDVGNLELFFYNGHVLPDTTNIENAIMPPPDGQWARPGTVDGPIGRFLLPIGGGLC